MSEETIYEDDIEEMLEAPIKMFNDKESFKIYGLTAYVKHQKLWESFKM